MKSSKKWERFWIDYLLVQMESTLSIATIGSFFAKDVRVPFYYFYIPAILGLVYMLPCAILYIKEDLSIKQVILQRIVEWVLIEAATLWLVWFLLGNQISNIVYIAIFVSIIILDALTYIITDRRDKKEVDDLNEILKEMKEQEE
ncbi:MAG: hypothetical protein Q4C49_03680 [Bacillota bacterium]|nr:hypothetical protein [Bacillota bacterium]